MGRAPCCDKVGLKRGRWTAEEDGLLARYIAQHGEGSWRSLPKNAGLLRCGKSCRLRWLNYLRTDVKRGNITTQEEDTIIKLHGTLGNRWSLIASHLPGRTDNEIKNYWNTHLSRRVHTFWGAPGPAVTIDIRTIRRPVTSGENNRTGAVTAAMAAAGRSDDGAVAVEADRTTELSAGLSSEGPRPWEADSETGGGPVVGQAQEEDLLDVDWESLAAQLLGGGGGGGGGAWQGDVDDLESLARWLMSDS